MYLHSRKLDLITYLVHLQDEVLLTKIEQFIGKKKNIDSPKTTNLLYENDLLERASKANQDYKMGKILSQEDVEIQSSKW